MSNEHALYAAGFIQCLTHTDGKWAGKPFELLPWQYDAVTKFYGTLRENGKRQYEYLYLEIPKKNSKSALAAALGLYHLLADGEIRGEIYICAADRGNAGIIFSAAQGMVEQDAALDGSQGGRIKIVESLKTMTDTETGSVLKVMSAEAYSKHGYKPSCVIFDELHAQPNRQLRDVMTFGAGDARDQPVWIVLTTAGDDPDKKSIGWEIHEKARKIRDGELDIDNWLPILYNAPEDADIYDEAVWYAVNPSLGHIIDIEKVRREAADARCDAGTEKLFRWLRLNQWVDLKSHSWLPLTLFDETVGKWNPAEMLGKKCYLGLDIGATTDLTALVAEFPPQGGIEEWRTLFWPFVPEEKMRERQERDHVDFVSWVRGRWITATPGNAVDYTFLKHKILECWKTYQVIALGTDQWNSRMLTQLLGPETADIPGCGMTRPDGKGMQIIEIAQTIPFICQCADGTSTLSVSNIRAICDGP